MLLILFIIHDSTQEIPIMVGDALEHQYYWMLYLSVPSTFLNLLPPYNITFLQGCSAPWTTPECLSNTSIHHETVFTVKSNSSELRYLKVWHCTPALVHTKLLTALFCIYHICSNTNTQYPPSLLLDTLSTRYLLHTVLTSHYFQLICFIFNTGT